MIGLLVIALAGTIAFSSLVIWFMWTELWEADRRLRMLDESLRIERTLRRHAERKES